MELSYRPKYHFTPLKGWMNDPNGLIYYKGNYHIFYQYNPFDIKWGPMHWGHAITKDFIDFKNDKIALKPDNHTDLEFGCFSGSAIKKDGKLYLMYTGVNNGKQTQCIAYEDSNGKFVKYDLNPVIDEKMLPEGYVISDFRDPKVWEKDGKYYAIIACKHKEDYSSILIFESEDLLKWNYKNIFYSVKEPHTMIECPSYTIVDGKEVLMFSLQFSKNVSSLKSENIHGVYYVFGKINYQTGVFESEDKLQLMDYGFDFYAPQVFESKSNQPLILSWLNMWDRSYDTQTEGWVGTLTMPRKLVIKNNKLYQKPCIGEKLFKSKDSYQIDKKGTIITSSNSYLLDINCNLNEKSFFQLCFKNEESGLIVSFHENVFSVDRSNLKHKIESKDVIGDYIRTMQIDSIIKNIKIYADVSNLEIYINNGEKVMSLDLYDDVLSHIDINCNKKINVTVKE